MVNDYWIACAFGIVCLFWIQCGFMKVKAFKIFNRKKYDD